MKAIVIAAGSGLRLRPLSNDRPKCMLPLNGRTLLEHQIQALREAGIDRIAVVKGYRKEAINYPGLAYYINGNYQNNNILHSLFYAEEEMKDAFIAAYSDILYDAAVIKSLLDSREDISIVVDINWRKHYEGRAEHPLEEAENVIFDADNYVVKIGKILPDKNTLHGEFIGMMKCSDRGAHTFREYFRRLKQIYSGKAFQRAPVFEQAYLTDFFQDMADCGVRIKCVIIKNGWIEIDTPGDYQKALREFSVCRKNGGI